MTISQPNSAPCSGAWRRVLWLGAFLALAACQSSPAPSNAPGDIDGASAEAGGKTAPGSAQAAIQKKDSPTAQANETPAADGKADDSKPEKVKDQSEGLIDFKIIAREMWLADLPAWRNKACGEEMCMDDMDRFGSIAREKCMNGMDRLEGNLGYKDKDFVLDYKDFALGFCDCFGQEVKESLRFEGQGLERLLAEKARIEDKKAAGKKLTQEETEFERSYEDALFEITEGLSAACLGL